jgi:hypothetical protein
MELADLRSYWASLNRRLVALDAKLDELETLASVTETDAEYAETALGVVTEARAEIAECRMETERVQAAVTPVLARAEDVAALATVIKAVPWKDSESIHVFADNVAAALSSFIRTGATSFMVETEPDPRGSRHGGQEGPANDGVALIILRASVSGEHGVGILALQSVATFHRESGCWPTAQQVAQYTQWEVGMAGFILGALTNAGCVQRIWGPNGTDGPCSYALTFLGWHIIGEYKRGTEAERTES